MHTTDLDGAVWVLKIRGIWVI